MTGAHPRPTATPADPARAVGRRAGDFGARRPTLVDVRRTPNHEEGDGPGDVAAALAADGLAYHAPPAAVRGFARAVADRLSGGTLRWDDRRDLVARAARLGIDRFEANLIIAGVQHAADAGDDLLADDAAGWRSGVVAFALAQASILAAVWWRFRGVSTGVRRAVVSRESSASAR